MITTLESRFTVTSDSDIGLVRQSNQDAVFAWASPPEHTHPRALLLVADGMGGLQAGHVASQLAIQAITDSILPLLEQEHPPAIQDLVQHLEQAFQAANHAIIDYAAHKLESYGQMGTTLTAALVLDDQAVIANVGDSRAYRHDHEGLQQLTVDHTLVGQLIADGFVEPTAIFDYPQRNLLTRGVGLFPLLQVDTYRLHIAQGDRLLLCTDGLWGMIRDLDEFERILSLSSTPAGATQALIETANKHGGEDNIGLVVCDISRP